MAKVFKVLRGVSATAGISAALLAVAAICVVASSSGRTLREGQSPKITHNTYKSGKISAVIDAEKLATKWSIELVETTCEVLEKGRGPEHKTIATGTIGKESGPRRVSKTISEEVARSWDHYVVTATNSAGERSKSGALPGEREAHCEWTARSNQRLSEMLCALVEEHVVGTYFRPLFS